MSHSYSRDKLEESRRRKRAQQAAQQQRVNLPSAKSWLGVTPSQVAKPAQQTAPKTTVSRPAVQSSASWKGVTPSQVAKPAARQTAPKAAQTAAVKQLPTFSVGQSLAQRTQQNIKNDNTRRARAARAREGQRQAAQANAAALKKDRAALAANSLKWHQTSDAAVRQRLEAENSAIRARRGYAYDTHTGSTYDSKGNELSLAARQIYGGRAETAKQFRDVAQTKDFVRDTSRTAAQPSILDVARGVTADNPYYAIESGRKAHSIIASLLNRSDETWTDADTKARDEARDALQQEMQAIYQQYGAAYQPRLSADETVKDLARRGADEQTLEYVRENLRLRDASDRLGQGLTAVGKRLEASIPSLIDTAKQAISNQSENKANEAFTRLEEQEKQLELQLQNMQSQDENGRVPADYQRVYDQLQRVREEKNSLKVEKGVDQNLWSQRVLREANEAQANAEAGLAPAPRWVTEQAISLASNAPTMAASAVPVVGPALVSLVMGAQAAGQRAFELNEQGKSAGEALGRGTVSGIIEAATEKLPLERMAEILHSGGANAVKNILRQMGTEATEEGASYFLNYVSDLAAADPDAKFSLAELAQSAAGGAFGGLVFGAAGAAGAKLAQRNEGGIYDDTAYERDVVRSLQDADAQLRAARSLPEGAGREAAVSAAREKMSQTIADFVGQQAAESAERAAAYDADPNGRMSLAQRAQAAEYLNQRTGQADAWQDGQVKPRLGTETEQRPESGYRTPEEESALQSQLAKHFADERQVETGGVYDREAVENYRNQIDGTFDGSLPSDMNISLGQTPKVLQSLGAENLPLRMTQNAARKIAYPDGYMGGKHNLGIPALKHLQEQLNDPIAVLKSKSQHDSFVVLTEWNDTENNPVVAAIHLNKQGVVDDVNMLASAYGKRNLAALLGENNENVIYTKNNKGINQTLDGRLQLPGLLSDDTLVAYSIRQNAENSNTSDTNIPLSEAMQYGKTPEQAMMEAKAKAEGERVREAMNRPEMHEARRIAERLGAKFEVADLGAAGGRYENGTITINPYADNPVRQVLVHELTHHLENSGAYADLQAAALRAFSEEQGVSADVLRQNITKLYAERGVTLDQDGANRELTAAFCENRLFKDENSIQRLAQTDVSLFQRIRQWLSDLVIRLRGTEEQKRVLEVQRLYEKAARNVGAVQDRGAQYTFGREYDNETLAKAVQMEQEGADKDTIWNTLGVIRDTKGNWINEIDDSQMNYDEFGLHQLRKDPDFRRLEELEDKANATAENFGYSPEEYAEWETLTDKYDDAVWDDKYMLRDYLKHDELFKRYPSLRIASLVFEPMRAGERGYYNRSDNSIHVNELLKSEPESTLLHEIQHFVQGRDNRPGGANPEYWRLMTENADEWIDRNLLLSRKQKIIERMNTIEQQVGYSDFYDSLLDREEAGELTSEQVDALDREFVARYPELEALRNELYNDVYMKLKELGKSKRDPGELYRSTAGEIEARETASRRNMTAEERRQKTPDLGWDRAVFAEDAGTTAEIKYPVYTPEAIHENQRKLRDMQPVTKLTGNEFAKGDTDLMTQVLNYFDSLGNSVYSEQFGDVALTKSSWRSERRHGMTALKANTFAAVPDVIRNGVVIDYMQKHDGAVDRIVAAAPIQIGTDADYYVGVMLQRDQQSQRLYLHDVVALKNQGQKNKTQTWHQNPDVSRSSSNLDISSILRNALEGNTSVQNTFGFTPEQIAKGTVPLSDAMQYGKTPEQAMMEARAKADESRSSSDFDTSGISPDTENGNMENAANRQAGLLGNYQRHGKSVDQAMRELQNKLTEKHSFLYDDDSKQVRAVQSAALRETWILARPVHEQIERFKQDHPLSSRDEQLLQAALVNDATDTFSRCDDPAAVMHRYQLQQELNRRMQPIRDYQRARDETMALNAEEMADTIAEFAKDKKIPGAYSRETMERNSYDIFGKKNRAYAERLNDDYFAPVHKAVADRTNYVNTMRQQVADLHLSKHESALVQMALEGRNDVAAEYIKNNKIKITSALQKNVADGVATFQAIYKELYESINETLLSNGMEPVRARKNYAPHFVKDKPDTMLGRIRFALGLGKDSNLALPTDIAGITDDFSPGKKWFGNLLQREGELTDYDAVAGFDRYIETAGDVIFLTDSVQQLRSLEDALRYRLSDEGTREKVNQIRNDRNLNALERHQKIDEAYNSNQDNIQKLYNQKKQGMGGYVSNLHEYINNLAGKKARADRGWEELIGRQMYTVAKNVEGRVAANMIAANPGSWITNFIPITQAGGEVSAANLIRAMRDTVKSAVKDDGFTDGSVFLTNREGTQLLDRTLTRKISDIAGMPMEAIDHFASNVVTRAKYLQNIQDGMGMQEAFDNADTFAANLMADRSKGAQPTAFNSVNPIRKVFTMFQLEVNNQLSYLFKDLPRAKQSVPKLAWAYTKVFTGAYLFNAVYHQLTGRDSAFDPIGMIADAFGFDPFDDDEDKDKKKSGVDIALDLGKNAAEQIPFVGGLIGGGRVPISAAFPDFGKLIEEYENGYDKKRIALDAAKSAANSAAYLLLPFGGGALKRTAEGAATIYAGGSYHICRR